MISTAEQWYGSLGAGWKAMRFKHVATIVGGQVDPTDDRYSALPLFAPNHMESGTGRLLAVDSAEDQAAESGKYLVADGDVLYSKIRPALRKVVVAPTAGLCSADVYAIRPNRRLLEPRFLFYLLLSEGFAQYSLLESDRVAMPKINREALGECPLVFPALDRQRAIVGFLDAKTANIDTLIAKQEQLLALLAEKRQALITQAVTKGLDPNVPMKDSGVEWLGRIPSHWTVKKLGLLLRGIEQGWSPECISRPPEPGEWGVLKAGAVNSGVLDEMESKALPDDLEPIPTLEVRPGDILMSRASGSPLWVGSVGIVRATARRLILCDKLYRLAIDRQQLEPEYAVLVLRSPAVRQLIDAGATGQSTLRNIGQDFVRGIVFAWPPFEEQQRIVEHVQSELRGLDALSQRVQAMIEKLREYRQALITAAVTGQLDVTATEAEQAANVVEAATA